MVAHVGCSGWNYKWWKVVFYPKGLRQKDWLSFYGSRFGTLELNFTFYRQPTEETFRRWYASVPSDFLFSAKMSRFITHTRRLDVGHDSIERFFGPLALLGDKLGVVLIQLPPTLPFDEALVSAFFSLLPPAFRYCVEARHESWVAERFFSLLKDRNIAWCISETAGRYPYFEAVTADFVYVRLHGREKLYASSYRDDDLEAIRGKIASWGKEAFVYFDNDFEGYATKNAATLKAMLEK